jgi:hypothetical protein
VTIEKTSKIQLHEIAHARAGDKGNRLNICLFAYDEKHYPLILSQVTPEVVFELFRHRNPTQVLRYELPKLLAVNFVIDEVLEGGVNMSLNLDGHGKTLSYLLLSMKINCLKELL